MIYKLACALVVLQVLCSAQTPLSLEDAVRKALSQGRLLRCLLPNPLSLLRGLVGSPALQGLFSQALLQHRS